MIFVPDEELDVGLCVCSGQVFRFRKLEDGWIGIDSSNIIRAKRVKKGWRLESFPDANAVCRFFQLHRSALEIAEKIVRIAPELRPYVQAHRGLRVLRPERVDETLFTFLCTPNNNIERITGLVAKLAEYGEEIGKGNGWFAFPTVERIAKIPESELRAKAFGYRGRVLPRVARNLMQKPKNWLESLKHVPYEEAKKSLCEFEGVGQKVADCVCLIGLGHECAVPVDTHLWNRAIELYFPEWKGKSMTERRYNAIGEMFRERFGDLAGWAHQYLFYDRMLSSRSSKKA